MEDSGGNSLRIHVGYLFASGPALALVLHLPMKCGSCTPGLEFCCWIVSREEGYCVSWVPLGVERVAYMTAAYLETSSRNLSNEYGNPSSILGLDTMLRKASVERVHKAATVRRTTT